VKLFKFKQVKPELIKKDRGWKDFNYYLLHGEEIRAKRRKKYQETGK